MGGIPPQISIQRIDIQISKHIFDIDVGIFSQFSAFKLKPTQNNNEYDTHTLYLCIPSSSIHVYTVYMYTKCTYYFWKNQLFENFLFKWIFNRIYHIYSIINWLDFLISKYIKFDNGKYKIAYHMYIHIKFFVCCIPICAITYTKFNSQNF